MSPFSVIKGDGFLYPIHTNKFSKFTNEKVAKYIFVHRSFSYRFHVTTVTFYAFATTIYTKLGTPVLIRFRPNYNIFRGSHANRVSAKHEREGCESSARLARSLPKTRILLTQAPATQFQELMK